MSLPTHVAIIMDGNRRWARQKGLVPTQGHAKVANEVIKQLVEHCLSKNIPFLTLWAFSTENWKRSDQEISMIFELFRQAFKKNAQELHQKGIKLLTVGDLSKFPEDIQQQIAHWKELTAQNTQMTVIFALNYGGRDEIVRAVNALIKDKGENVSKTPVTQEDIAQYLDTSGIPDPDLVIRPGTEVRLSGFLPWQTTYSELYFTPTLMPDFGPDQFQLALDDYAQRKRRFGK